MKLKKYFKRAWDDVLLYFAASHGDLHAWELLREQSEQQARKLAEKEQSEEKK